jgi:hypothetical protein
MRLCPAHSGCVRLSVEKFLLEDGQRNAAAALFDAARTLKPTDMTVQNNFAFCILVDKPGQARELLADVLARGARAPAVTLCNLALAESLLGHADAALKACAEGYGEADDSQTAYLWIRDDEDWAVDFTKLRPWAIRLGVELEQSVGAPGRIWAERLERLILLEPRSASSDPSSTRTGEEDL